MLQTPHSICSLLIVLFYASFDLENIDYRVNILSIQIFLVLTMFQELFKALQIISVKKEKAKTLFLWKLIFQWIASYRILWHLTQSEGQFSVVRKCIMLLFGNTEVQKKPKTSSSSMSLTHCSSVNLALLIFLMEFIRMIIWPGFLCIFLNFPTDNSVPGQKLNQPHNVLGLSSNVWSM